MKINFETNLLKLFMHPEISMIFYNFLLFLRSALSLNRSKLKWQRFVCFLQVSIALNYFITPPAL